MVPVTEAVNVPFFTKYIDEQGKFNADEGMLKGAEGMLKELLKWTETLRQMRNKNNSRQGLLKEKAAKKNLCGLFF